MLRSLSLSLLSLPLLVGCLSTERSYNDLNVEGYEVMRELEPGQVALRNATLDGDIGPIDGLQGSGFGSGYMDEYSSRIQVDSETPEGTAFVVLYVNDAQAFANLPRGVAHTFTGTDQSVLTAQGCSDTYAGEHYDAVADEVSLTFTDIDHDTVEVEYEVWSERGDLSESPLGTSATGTFQMDTVTQ